MLNEIKELLRHPDVRDAMAMVGSRGDAVRLLVEAGSRKGYRLSAVGVSKAFAEVAPVRTRSLSEQELVMVSGGMQSDNAPQLCYTAS